MEAYIPNALTASPDYYRTHCNRQAGLKKSILGILGGLHSTRTCSATGLRMAWPKDAALLVAPKMPYAFGDDSHAVVIYTHALRVQLDPT